jgi:ribulose-phosphate 3-epimerase
MQICPSILEKKAKDYFATIDKLSPYYKYFQIDIADGIYVDNKTASLDDFIYVLKRTYPLQPTPYNLTFDFHLMVKDCEKEIKKLEKLKDLINIKNVFIHSDLLPNYQLLTTHYPLSIGLVLNPQDRVADLATHYPLLTIPFLQIMSVVPGVQGNPFIPDSLKKIEQLRVLGYKSKIFLDGAVNEKTLSIMNKLKYKPDVICPGSYLTKAENLINNVKYLEQFKS